MRIVHIGNKSKKLSKKDLEREEAKKWVLKQRAVNSKKALKIFDKDIQEIRKVNPDFLTGRLIQL